MVWMVLAGYFRHSFHGTMGLIEKDRPDLIVAESFSVGAGTAAEIHDIPVLYAWTPGWAHPTLFSRDHKLTVELPFWQPSESVPEFILTMNTKFFMCFLNFLCDWLGAAGVKEFKEVRRQYNLTAFDNYMEYSVTFPTMVMAGEPVNQMVDAPPGFTVTGLLPPPPETGTVDKKLQTFLDQSKKPILYVAMGTYYAYTDEDFAIVKTALEKQDKFNVIWSHRYYDEAKFPVKDKNQMLVRKKIPQQHVLQHPNT